MSEQNININSIKLHNGQTRVIKDILKKNTRYNIINCSRQWGKTVVATQLALYWSMNEPQTKLLYVTPVYQLSRNIYNQIVQGLEKTNTIQEKFKNELFIKFINGSTIEFRSSTNYDNIRGGSYNYVICDEFSYMEPEAWLQSIRQTMNVIGKQALLISTPRGKNLFYQLAEMGKNPEFKDYSYNFGHYSENPLYNEQEVIDAKKTLPDNIYKQEYEAVFLDDGGSVFQNIQSVSTIYKFEKKGNKFYAGLDLGRIQDYTVLTILNEMGEVQEIYRRNKIDWTTITKDVLYILKKYNAQCYVEVNSIGDVIYENLSKDYKKLTPFFTSSSSKNDLIEQLIMSFNTKSITIPHKELFPQLHHELNTFSFTYSPKARKIVYGAMNGFHDDTVISLALANKCYKDKKQMGNYNYSFV